MKTLTKFIFLVITGRMLPAFNILREHRVGAQLTFLALGLVSYVVHQYPRELYSLGERAYFASELITRSNNDGIPLSRTARQNLAQLITTLRAEQSAEFNRRDLGIEKGYVAWTIAQIAVSYGNVPPVDPASVRQFFEKTMDDDCGCWRETPQRQPHTGATGWTVYAMSTLGIPAPSRAVSFLLSLQGPEGWWGLHPTKPEPGSASTYATAWATLALCTQMPLQQKSGSSDDTGRIKAAVDKALAWLMQSEIQDTARWYDYPANGAKMNSASISGLVLHVLAKCGATSQLERQHRKWLDGMPAAIASASTAEVSNVMVTLASGGLDFDRTRNYVLQWTMIATVDAYASGSLLQKAAARQWLERILTPALVSDEVRKQTWVGAELLLALSNLAAALDQPLSGPAKS